MKELGSGYVFSLCSWLSWLKGKEEHEEGRKLDSIFSSTDFSLKGKLTRKTIVPKSDRFIWVEIGKLMTASVFHLKI